MYKKDLALNNLQWSICHKTKPNQTKKQNKAIFSDNELMQLLLTYRIRL